jgi:hypothetical protein
VKTLQNSIDERSQMSWSSQFEQKITLPSGRSIETLKDAALYVVALPKTDQRKNHWQAAAAALMVASECNGSMLIAEYAMRQALMHDHPEEEW